MKPDLPGNVLTILKETIMKTKFTAIALILTSGLIAGTPAFADVTREQVKAELAAAVRTGDIMVGGESSLKRNELSPSHYPAAAVTPSATREQRQAEFAEAVRTGNILASGESNLKLNELYPNRYPDQAVHSSVTRAQVKTELVQAVRSGDMLAGGESGLKLNQLYPNRYSAM